MTEMIKCVSCGADYDAALRRCPYCGTATPEADEKEYMENVFETRRELEYVYVKKASIFYDLKMIIYTLICILYALVGKECTWILNDLRNDAAGQ